MSFARTLDQYRREDGDRMPFWRGDPPTDLAQVVGQIESLSPQQLLSAIRFLGELKDQRAVSTLARLMANCDAESAQLAAQTIATIGGPVACPALLDALSMARTPSLRLALVYALTWLIDDRALSSLLQTWQDRYEQLAVRLQAAEGLTYLADNLARFSPLWKQIVESFVGGLADSDLDVRLCSISALGTLRVDAAVTRLQMLTGSDPIAADGDDSLRLEALDAIDRIEHGWRNPVDAA